MTPGGALTANVFVDRPPEEVFGYLIELHDAEWRAPFPEMKLISESYEGVGATHIEVRTLMGRRIETRAETVIYEPNRRWAVRRASGPVRPQVTYALEPEGAGTRLAFEFDVPVLEGLARVLAPLVRFVNPLVERTARADLERLKHKLEGSTAPRERDQH